MGLILADHEDGFEIARQGPAFARGIAILAVAVLLVLARNYLFKHERRLSPGRVLASVSLALAALAVLVGVVWVQQTSYTLCGPVFHIWIERVGTGCDKTMQTHRDWVTVLGRTATIGFLASIAAGFLSRRQSTG